MAKAFVRTDKGTAAALPPSIFLFPVVSARLLSSLGLVLLLFLLQEATALRAGLPGKGVPPGQAQQLVAGQPIERELAGSEVHDYELFLVAGEFVRLTAEGETQKAANSRKLLRATALSSSPSG